jgi:hypothetical protein
MSDNDRKLPPRARAKIFTLIDQEAALQTAMHANLRQISELGKAYDISSDDQRRIEIKQESDHRQEVQATQRERHHALADLNGKIRRFLDLLAVDAVLDDAKPPKIKLKPGQTHQQAVAELRGQIVKLISERSQVERAALPIAEIKAQVKKWINQHSMRTQPQIVANHETFTVKFEHYLDGALAPVLDIAAMLAWFDPEHFEEKLMALIDQMPTPKLAMTPTEKSERLAAIKVELGDAERLESALIDDALENAIMIDHRPNVDIRALLALVVSKKKANAA